MFFQQLATAFSNLRNALTLREKEMEEIISAEIEKEKAKLNEKSEMLVARRKTLQVRLLTIIILKKILLLRSCYPNM